MSNHEEFPAFSAPGDSREEALWQAYQAILRRRNDPPARGPATDAPHRSPESKPAHQVGPNAARRIAPRSAAAQAAEPGPLVFQPIESPDADAGAGTPPPADAVRPSAARRAALGVVVVLAGGAALAVALLRPGTIVGTRPHAAPAQRPILPCFVDGQLVGQFTLDDCTSRNGVASGSLQVDAAAAPAQTATPTVAPGVAQPPTPAPPPVPAQARPPLAVEPPVPAPSPIVAREPRFDPLPTPQPPARFAAPQPEEYEPASSGEGYDRAPVAQVPPRRASALAVREFYSALGEGDGDRAAQVVVPEKRDTGPLSARALTRFYGSLRAPLRITGIDPISDDTVFVRYEFVNPDNRRCVGSATVDTAHRDGDTLVKGVRPFNVC